MRTLLFIAVITVAAIALAVLLIRRAGGGRSTQQFSFKEVLEDSGKREALTRMMNPENLDKLSDAEVRGLVEAYVRTQQQSPEHWAVRELKERAVPFLIEVLKRPESFVKPKPGGILDESPAERALDMLAPYPRDELIPLLLPLVGSAQPWQRRAAAGHLAATGRASVKDALCTLLKDDDNYVRSLIVYNLLTAAKAGRAEPALLAGAFEPLQRLVGRKSTPSEAATLAELLLRIDRPQAAEFLTSRPVINAANENAAGILNLLTLEKVPVPPELLLPLITPDGASRPPFGSLAYGEALKNLALQKHSSAETLIQATLNEPPAAGEADLPRYLRPRQDRQKLAAEALCLLNDLPNPIQTAFENEKRSGFSQLPVPQRRLVLVVYLDGQVNNGGFEQYFFNASDDAGEVAAALEDIGLAEAARTFRHAVSAFGKAGPSLDLDARRRQLEKLGTSGDERLEAANERWFALSADIQAPLYLYALKHKREFGILPERPGGTGQ
jgi:Domain of unknown function (DUF4375)/HEAT repeats